MSRRKPYPPEIRLEAQRLYVYELLDYQQISNLLGPATETLARWGRKWHWQTLREASASSGPGLADECRAAMAQIIQEARQEGRRLTTKEIDEMSKLNKIVGQNDPSGRFKSYTIEALNRFSEFVKRRDAELHRALTPHLSQFASDIVSSPTL